MATISIEEEVRRERVLKARGFRQDPQKPDRYVKILEDGDYIESIAPHALATYKTRMGRTITQTPIDWSKVP